jgi:hypothetical protein
MAATLDELIEQKLEALKHAPLKFQDAILRDQERVWTKMLSDLKKIETVDGKIVFSKDNLAKVDSIMNNLKANLFGGEYLTALKTFVNQIPAQAEFTNKILGESVEFESDSAYKALINKAQQNTLLLFDANAITANIVQPISAMLTNAIAGNADYLESVDQLRGALVGENAKLAKYANTYTKDALAQSDRQYTQLVSKEHGIEFWKYDGPEIGGTRFFCCVRKGGYYHTKEIEEWGDDASLWDNDGQGHCAKHKGGGRNPDTNSSTIFTLLGGYGCIDVLIPVGIQFVPDADIQRAISEGYYVPDM